MPRQTDERSGRRAGRGTGRTRAPRHRYARAARRPRAALFRWRREGAAALPRLPPGSGSSLDARDVDAVALERRYQRGAIGRASTGRPDVDDALAHQRTERIDHRLHSQTATAFDGDRQLRGRAVEHELANRGAAEEHFARGDPAAGDFRNQDLRHDRAEGASEGSPYWRA